VLASCSSTYWPLRSPRGGTGAVRAPARPAPSPRETLRRSACGAPSPLRRVSSRGQLPERPPSVAWASSGFVGFREREPSHVSRMFGVILSEVLPSVSDPGGLRRESKRWLQKRSGQGNKGLFADPGLPLAPCWNIVIMAHIAPARRHSPSDPLLTLGAPTRSVRSRWRRGPMGRMVQEGGARPSPSLSAPRPASGATLDHLIDTPGHVASLHFEFERSLRVLDGASPCSTAVAAWSPRPRRCVSCQQVHRPGLNVLRQQDGTASARILQTRPRHDHAVLPQRPVVQLPIGAESEFQASSTSSRMRHSSGKTGMGESY